MDTLLNLAQAAKVLGLAQVTVRKLVRSKQLGAVRIGKRLLFEPWVLQRFIENHRTQLAIPQTQAVPTEEVTA